ncbi:MAG TPA: S8 family serine peptidase, partial [Cytophagaceae bacterium]
AGCYQEASTQKIPWGVIRVGYGSGAGKTAWVVDTGVDIDHPDLIVDKTRSMSFIPGTSVDDDHGHGTHVAGIIAARNNNIGVVGVAADATIIALKVMNKDGKGSLSNVIQAVAHIGKMAKPGDVVNMSIGGGSSKTLDEEVLKVAEKGVLFAVAAGNEGIDCRNSSPARINHPNIFTVSAMNDKDVFASFSNYSADIVDFCAPGTFITSTFLNGTYSAMTGTSMATPHVAGLLILKGKNISIDGYVKEDPDGKADPIAHK